MNCGETPDGGPLREQPNKSDGRVGGYTVEVDVAISMPIAPNTEIFDRLMARLVEGCYASAARPENQQTPEGCPLRVTESKVK